MEKLAKYLMEHIQIDFTGDIDLEQVKEMLNEDGSARANLLLSRIAQEGIDDLLIVVADCLKEWISEGINEKTILKHLEMYAEA